MDAVDDTDADELDDDDALVEEVALAEAELVGVAKKLFDGVAEADADAHDDGVTLADEVNVAAGDALSVPEALAVALDVPHSLEEPLDEAVLVAETRKLFEDVDETVADALEEGVALGDAVNMADGDSLPDPHALDVTLPVALPLAVLLEDDELVAVSRKLFDAVGDTDADAHDDEVALDDAVDEATGDTLPVPETLALLLEDAVLVAVARKLLELVPHALTLTLPDVDVVAVAERSD